MYGHLSKESIAKHTIGDNIKKDERIGRLGNYEENGEWVLKKNVPVDGEERIRY